MNVLEKVVGKKIETIKGLEKGSDEVVFQFSDGSLTFWHMQDCCESVCLEEFDLDVDLSGSVILSAEEIEGESASDDDIYESYTWTFYKIETTKGGLFMRWLGSSNGYYSEAVDLSWKDA